MSLEKLESAGEDTLRGQRGNEKYKAGRLDTVHSAQDGEQLPQIDRKAEIKVLLKLDIFIMPIIFCLYASAFFDRGIIGNAQVAGLPQDLGLQGTQFNVATSIFYVSYVVFETPLAILVKRFPANYVLSIVALAWSITTTLSCFLQNYGGLLATRLILGTCEAGLFPAMNVYMAGIYRRHEQAQRVSYLFSAAAISSAFAGLIAYVVIAHMDGLKGLAAWRWLYIIFGLFSFLIAVWAFFGLPGKPGQAYFLSMAERELMAARYKEMELYSGHEYFEWKEVRKALKDPKVYMSAFIQFNVDTCLYSLSVFLPIILKSMGFSTLQANYLTIPVYLLGAASFIACAWLSDRLRCRSPFMLGSIAFGIVGYIILLTVTKEAVLYFATFLCGLAIYTGVGLNVAWILGNTAGSFKRATAIGFQQSLGNTAGVLAGQIYTTDSAPRYIKGHAINLGALCLAVFGIIALDGYYLYQNRAKQRAIDSGLDDDRPGDDSFHFRYHY